MDLDESTPASSMAMAIGGSTLGPAAQVPSNRG